MMIKENKNDSKIKGFICRYVSTHEVFQHHNPNVIDGCFSIFEITILENLD